MRPRQSERGFTITELLVALTVTVIGLAGLLSLHVTTVRGNASAASAAEASNVAELTLEEHRGLSVRAIDTRYAVGAPLPDGTDWPVGAATEAAVTLGVVTGRNDRLFHRRLYALEVAGQPNLIRYRVIVFWLDAGALVGDPDDETALNGDGVAPRRIELQMIRTRVEVF